MRSALVRERFVRFFVERQHVHVPSSSLVPQGDRSLLFTNAGMVQFKDVFLGRKTLPYRAAVSVQRCMRAGGKHNDLDNVGYTPRHHTYFEMLGNFSFGEYFKHEAINYAWLFLVHDLRLPPERLRVTVLEGDQESLGIWHNHVGLPRDRILTRGPADNFWSMGDGEGPCGPCTEIFWDLGPDASANDDDRWLEIWNLVFMQHHRHADGSLSPLTTPAVDTGMGLERIASVLQGKINNYDIDTFVALTSAVLDLLQRRGIATDKVSRSTPQVRIIADHLRACCFLIADRVLPSNTGRSYVLRRILRRAVNAGWQLGIAEPFLAELVPALLTTVPPDAHAHLTAHVDIIRSLLEKEEAMFFENLKRGLQLLEPVGASTGVISGELAFQLHDTYGFPLDLTAVIARERAWKVDVDAAERLMQQQRDRGRASWTGISGGAGAKNWASEALAGWSKQGLGGRFTGYQLKSDVAYVTADVLAVAPKPFEKGDNNLSALVVLDSSPFYPRGGGQVPDEGFIESAEGRRWNVVDAQSLLDGSVALTITSPKPVEMHAGASDPFEYLRRPSVVLCHVDMTRRRAIEVHHTATHLLHAALRSVLGVHVTQAGSLVEAKRLRFDFTHPQALTADEMQAVAAHMNDAVASQLDLRVMESEPLQGAISRGAMSLFNEKYPDHVRTVEIPGFSLELCGGTHVDNTKALFPVQVLSDSAIAAGVRRIEAVAGATAVDWMTQELEVLQRAAGTLKTNTTELVPRLVKLQESSKALSAQLGRAHQQLASVPVLGVTTTVHVPGHPTVIIHELPSDLDAEVLRRRAQHLRQMHPEHVHVLLLDATVVCALNPVHLPPRFRADTMLADLMQRLGGRGGGQVDWAQGRVSSGAPSASSVASAVEAVLRQVNS